MNVIHKKFEDEWLLVDTETTGIAAPIYVVEVFAYRMRGAQPSDDGCHVFLDHGVYVPPEATAIHGYTKELLSKIGIHPQRGHKTLEEYVGDLPVCSHNLPYDLNRCLLPERRRLGRTKTFGEKGFCTLQLFRRSLPASPSYKLDVIRDVYNLDFPAHSAKGDVMTVSHMFENHIFPKLWDSGIRTFEDIRNFSLKNPISTCRSLLGLEPLPSAASLATSSAASLVVASRTKQRGSMSFGGGEELALTDPLTDSLTDLDVVGGAKVKLVKGASSQAKARGIEKKEKKGFWATSRGEKKVVMATEKQKQFIRALGGGELPEGYSKKRASKKIEELLGQKVDLGFI